MASRYVDITARFRSGTVGIQRDRRSAARADLIAAVAATMAARGLSQVQAARLCLTDQPTLSKVLRGRTESVTLDKLVDWLLALGRHVEIRVGRLDPRQEGMLTAVVDGRSDLE
jgi:predicted XRE-type DNA-binding protein